MQREGHGCLAAVDRRRERPRPAPAAHEIDARIQPRIADPEDGAEHQAREDRDVEPLHHGAAGGHRALGGEPIPATVHIHAEARAPLGLHRPIRRLQAHRPADRAQEGGRREAVQPPHDAVIAEDAHFVGRKTHRQQAAGRFSCPLGGHVGGGGAVMAVGDIERADLIETRRQSLDLVRTVDRPERVAHPAVEHGAAERRSLAGRRDEPAAARVGRVDQQDGAGLRAERGDVPGAVLLPVRPGRFVPLDRALFVGRERGRRHQPGLRAAGARHAVGVEAGRGVADQESLVDHPRERRRRALVERRRAGRRLGRQVDLRTGDAEEAPRPVPHGGARLRHRQHVVGRRRHRLGMARGGAEACEGGEQAVAHGMRAPLVITAPS